MNTSYDESTGGGFVGGSSVELKTPSRSRRAGNNPPTWYVAQNEQTYFDPNHVPPPQSVMGGPIPQSERIGGEYFAPGGLVTQAPRKATGLVLNRPDGKSGIRKKMRTSCNLCTKRKKGCDGDGVTACRRVFENRGLVNRGWRREMLEDLDFPTHLALPHVRGQLVYRVKKRMHIQRKAQAGTQGRVGFPKKGQDQSIQRNWLALETGELIRRVLDKLEWMNPHDGNAGIPSGSDSADAGTGRGSMMSGSSGGSGATPSGPLLCTFWCTVGLGAMVNGAPDSMMEKYINLAAQALGGSESKDADTLRAYVILIMIFQWANASKVYYYLQKLEKILESMDPSNIPMEVSDMLEYHERVNNAHVNEDLTYMKKCAYAEDRVAPEITPALLCESGLFHVVHFYSDGVFKAFWKDILLEDKALSNTKAFSDKHLEDFKAIASVAERRPDYKGTTCSLYVVSTMSFMHLPLETPPMEAFKRYTECIEVIVKLPGLFRNMSCLHYCHSLLVILSVYAQKGIDQGAYEGFRKCYNKHAHLHKCAKAPPAKECSMKKLCDAAFCRGMSWALACKAEAAARRAMATTAIPSSSTKDTSGCVITPACAPGTQPPSSQRVHASGMLGMVSPSAMPSGIAVARMPVGPGTAMMTSSVGAGGAFNMSKEGVCDSRVSVAGVCNQRQGELVHSAQPSLQEMLLTCEGGTESMMPMPMGAHYFIQQSQYQLPAMRMIQGTEVFGGDGRKHEPSLASCVGFQQQQQQLDSKAMQLVLDNQVLTQNLGQPVMQQGNMVLVPPVIQIPPPNAAVYPYMRAGLRGRTEGPRIPPIYPREEEPCELRGIVENFEVTPEDVHEVRELGGKSKELS